MFEFLWKPSCNHDKITVNMSSAYCPDCGEYVENRWYITRCECCGIKQKTSIKNRKVVSQAKFCRNCGSESFKVEELERLDIVNINYAIVQKHVRENEKQGFIQTWIEHTNYSSMKLLPSY